MTTSQTVKVPINSKPYQNIDASTLSEFSETLIDGYIDDLGHTCKRPGLSVFTDLLTYKKIDGEYWWDNYSDLIAVSGGQIFKIIDSSGNFSEITGASLVDGTRCAFTENGTYVLIANGGQMVYTDNTTATAITDVDAPQNATHVAFLDQYAIANFTGTGRFGFCDFVNAPSSWSALDVYTAESAPDIIVALTILNRQLLLLGKQSAEYWISDGTTGVFSRVNGQVYRIGCIAPYTLVTIDGVAYWLSDLKKLVASDGGFPQSISTSFDKLIQSFNTVGDAFSERIYVNGIDLLKITFPTEKRTLFYDLKNKYWGEWGYWNTRTGSFEHWLGNYYVFAKDWNFHIIGDRRQGKLFKMDRLYYKDDDAIIRTLKRTGHVDHGTLRRKKSKRLILKAKCGVGITGDALNPPKLIMRFRDDGRSVWSNDIEFSLRLLGDTEFISTIYGLGIYKTRQYEFYMTDDAPLILIDAEEEIDILNG